MAHKWKRALAQRVCRCLRRYLVFSVCLEQSSRNKMGFICRFYWSMLKVLSGESVIKDLQEDNII